MKRITTFIALFVLLAMGLRAQTIAGEYDVPEVGAVQEDRGQDQHHYAPRQLCYCEVVTAVPYTLF